MTKKYRTTVKLFFKKWILELYRGILDGLQQVSGAFRRTEVIIAYMPSVKKGVNFYWQLRINYFSVICWLKYINNRHSVLSNRIITKYGQGKKW